MTDLGEAELTSEIYDILDACANDEIAPIVQSLVKSPVSSLKISRAYERHHPDHVQYKDQVGDEVYRLGLVVLGRSDGKRPSYEDMIAGLCKQIGIPSVANEITRNELLLLNTFSKRHL